MLSPAFDLHISTAFHRFQHGDFVGVFDVAADGNAHRDAGNFHPSALELLREISRCGFAFDGGIGGHDHFVYVSLIDASNEVRDAQLFGADSV